MKKAYMMIMIILFVISVGKVEEAYQEMTGDEGAVIPKIRRIDASYIAVSAWGEEGYINTADIFAGIHTVNYQMTAHAKRLIQQMMTAFGAKTEEEPIREAYGIEIL